MFVTYKTHLAVVLERQTFSNIKVGGFSKTARHHMIIRAKAQVMITPPQRSKLTMLYENFK